MANKSRKKQLKAAANACSSSSDRGYSYGQSSSNFGYYGYTPTYHAADTKRNIWSAFGYPDTIDFDMHWRMATRQGVGKAGIHRIVEKCWEKDPIITDGEFDGKRPLTPFEQDLEVLINEHHLFARLKGCDWRNRVGRYAGIIPIIRGSGRAEDPITPVQSVKAILKLVPVFESQIDTNDVETNSDLSDVNFGMPSYYNFRTNVPGDRNPQNNNQFQMDPSRVFVFAEGADDGSIYGVPVNEAGFNALLDLEKVSGAGAEGLYKNAQQRIVINVDDKMVAQTVMTNTEKKEQLDDEITAFSRDFDKELMLFGMTADTLQSTLADPTHPFTVALNIYCASINIPATILIGQQTGRLASDEDQKDYGISASSRCNNVLTPSLIIPFLKYMVDIGAMRPPVNDIMVEWPDFLEPSPSDKLTTAKTMMEINKLSREAGESEAVFTRDEIRVLSGYDPEPEGELADFGEDDDLPNEDEIIGGDEE